MTKFVAGTFLEIKDLDRHLAKVTECMLKQIQADDKNMKILVEKIINSKSKRTRSILVIASAMACDGEVKDELIKACAAIEYVHLASVIHDDIIDESDTRWGSAALHKKEGNGAAIVVGDYMLARAGTIASSISQEAGSLISETIARLCLGELAELKSRNDITRTLENYFYVIECKTASLLAAACEIGGLVSGADKETRIKLQRFGLNFGVSYQLIDDLLDLTANEKLLGKPVGGDIKEGIYTYPIIRSLLAGGHKAEMLRLIQSDNTNMDKILEILNADGSIKATIDRINEANTKATEYVKDVSSPGLQSLPGNYFGWSMKAKVR